LLDQVGYKTWREPLQRDASITQVLSFTYQTLSPQRNDSIYLVIHHNADSLYRLDLCGACCCQPSRQPEPQGSKPGTSSNRRPLPWYRQPPMLRSWGRRHLGSDLLIPYVSLCDLHDSTSKQWADVSQHLDLQVPLMSSRALVRPRVSPPNAVPFLW